MMEPKNCPWCDATVIKKNGNYCVGNMEYDTYWEILHKKGCWLFADDSTKTIVAVSSRSKNAWNKRSGENHD